MIQVHIFLMGGDKGSKVRFANCVQCHDNLRGRLTVISILLFLSALLVTLPAAASGDSCTLTAHSIPKGAAISIDGTLIGTAPQCSVSHAITATGIITLLPVGNIIILT